MSLFVVDVESDGPAPGLDSMVSFGAIKVEATLGTTFCGQVRPISEKWVPEALAVSGVKREEHQRYETAEVVMARFAARLKDHSLARPVFVSDNLAFDWQFINYYFHAFAGSNPFRPSHR